MPIFLGRDESNGAHDKCVYLVDTLKSTIKQYLMHFQSFFSTEKIIIIISSYSMMYFVL